MIELERNDFFWNDFIRWCADNNIPVTMSTEYQIYWACWIKAIEAVDENE